jgi:hypothetical protein
LNASASIRDNTEFDSNVIEESDIHSAKHSPGKTSIAEGRIILTKPVHLNADFSIRDNLDPDSNITEESKVQE